MAQTKQQKLELIRKAVAAVTYERVRQSKGSTFPAHVVPADQAKPRQLENALALMAPGRSAEDAAVLVDITALGSGKDGCLFMDDGIYMGRSFCVPDIGGSHAIPLVFGYETILHAGTNAARLRVNGDVNCWLLCQDRESKYRGTYVGPHAWFLSLCINEVLKALWSAGLIPPKPETPKQEKPKSRFSQTAAKPAEPRELTPAEQLNDLLRKANRGDKAAALEAVQMLRQKGSAEDLMQALPLAHKAGDSKLTKLLEGQLLYLHQQAFAQQQWQQAVRLCKVGRELKLPDSAYAYAKMVNGGLVNERFQPESYFNEAALWGSRDAQLQMAYRSLEKLNRDIIRCPNKTDPTQLSSDAKDRLNRVVDWYQRIANGSAEGPDLALSHLQKHREQIFQPDSLGYTELEKAVQEIELARKDWNHYGPPDLSDAAVKNFNRAKEQLSKPEAAAMAWKKIGDCYRSGNGVLRSRSEAISHYEVAGSQGIPAGYHLAALLLAEAGKWEQAGYYATQALLKDYNPAGELLTHINAHLPPDKQFDLPWRPGYTKTKPAPEPEKPAISDKRLALYRQAKEAVKNNDPDAVIAAVTPLVTEGDDELRRKPMLKRLLATAHRDRKQYDLAEQYAALAQSEGDESAADLLQQIRALQMQEAFNAGVAVAKEHPEQALPHFRRAAELGSSTAAFNAAVCLGKLAETMEQADEALAMLDQARELGYAGDDWAQLHRSLTQRKQELKKKKQEEESPGNMAVLMGLLHQEQGDMTKALASYEAAAELGSGYGCVLAAELYLSGNGTERDEYRAFCLLKQAAELQFGGAYRKLALLYAGSDDPRIPLDPAQARHWAEAAVAAGIEGAEETADVISRWLVGQSSELIQEGRWKDALPWMEQAALFGDSQAAFFLTGLYEMGSDKFAMLYLTIEQPEDAPLPDLPPEQRIEPDPAAYARWASLAADLGHERTLKVVSREALLGLNGFEPDLERAVGWMEKLVDLEAAEAGYTEHWAKKQKAARRKTMEGEYLWARGHAKYEEKAYEEAADLFTRSVELGYGTAAANMALLYMKKHLTVKAGTYSGEDYQNKMVVTWLERGAALNNDACLKWLATAYAEGHYGLDADLHQAIELLTQANQVAGRDPEEGLDELRKAYQRAVWKQDYKLALQYHENKNLTEAERYFRKAAASGDPDAICMLGSFLEMERPNHYEEYLALYAQAAEQGHLLALKYLVKNYCYGQKNMNISKAFPWAAKLWLHPKADDEQKQQFRNLHEKHGRGNEYLPLRRDGLQQLREKPFDPETMRCKAASEPQTHAYRYGEHLLLGIIPDESGQQMAKAYASGALTGDIRCIERIRQMRAAGCWPTELNMALGRESVTRLTDSWLEQQHRQALEAGVALPLFQYATELLHGGRGDRKRAAQLLQQMPVGLTVHFGHWDHRGDGVKLPISWVVLGANEDGITLISRDILDWCKEDPTGWLNREFLPTAFDARERELLGIRKIILRKTERNRVFLLGNQIPCRGSATGNVEALWKWEYPPIGCAAVLKKRGTKPNPCGRLLPWSIGDGGGTLALDHALRLTPANHYLRPCIWIPY